MYQSKLPHRTFAADRSCYHLAMICDVDNYNFLYGRIEGDLGFRDHLESYQIQACQWSSPKTPADFAAKDPVRLDLPSHWEIPGINKLLLFPDSAVHNPQCDHRNCCSGHCEGTEWKENKQLIIFFQNQATLPEENARIVYGSSSSQNAAPVPEVCRGRTRNSSEVSQMGVRFCQWREHDFVVSYGLILIALLPTANGWDARKVRKELRIAIYTMV